MKKLFLTAAIAVFGMCNISAQEISFGVKGGVNFANVNGDYGAYYGYDRDAKMKVGFHIGGLAEIGISEKFAVQPELLFSSQGYKSNYQDFDDGRNVDYNVNLSYVNMPIMAKFFPIENLAIEAGPQVGFLVSAKDEFNDYVNDYDPEDPDNVDSKDLYKSFDFGLNLGASYKMESGLFFSARYNFGLAKVDDDDYYDGYYGSGIFSFSRKNRVIQLSAGFMF